MWHWKRDRKFIRNTFLSFVNGDIDVSEFWEIYKENSLLQNALNKLKIYKRYPEALPEKRLENFDIALFSHRVRLYNIVAGYLLTNKIKFIPGNRDKLDLDFIEKALPPYVCIYKNMDFFHQILKTAPTGLDGNELKVWVKNKMLGLFQYEKIPPDWLQDPEWPIIQGEPLKFRSQKETEVGTVKYYFYNLKTKEEVVVEQVE